MGTGYARIASPSTRGLVPVSTHTLTTIMARGEPRLCLCRDIEEPDIWKSKVPSLHTFYVTNRSDITAHTQYSKLHGGNTTNTTTDMLHTERNGRLQKSRHKLSEYRDGLEAALETRLTLEDHPSGTGRPETPNTIGIYDQIKPNQTTTR